MASDLRSADTRLRHSYVSPSYANFNSFGKALVNRSLENYWESTGLASAAVREIRESKDLITDWNGRAVTRTELDASDRPQVQLAALLYQTGYLTIDSTTPRGMIVLRVPNKEVMDSVLYGRLIGCNYNPETRNLDRPEMEALGHSRQWTGSCQ